MIWILYYVVGFWLSFGLVVLRSVKESESIDVGGVAVEFDDEPSSIFAAIVIAMTWPICLPTLAVLKVSNMLRKPDTKTEGKNTAGHGYTVT